MNYENLARLIDGDAPAAAEVVASVHFGVDGFAVIESPSAEVVRLHDENQRMRDALEIIEHTLAILRGEK